MKNTMKKPVAIPVEKLRPFDGHPFKVKDDQKETIKVSAERLRAVLPKGMDSQKTEDFIIRACEHYRKYLRNRDRDSK